MKNTLLELIYIIAGLIAVMTAVYAFKDDKHPSPKGTALFGDCWASCLFWESTYQPLLSEPYCFSWAVSQP